MQLGLNALADLTHEEYKQKYALGYLKFQRSENRLSTFRYGDLDEASLPQEIDWRKQKAVAEVKNQQQVRSGHRFPAFVALLTQQFDSCDLQLPIPAPTYW